MLLFMFLGAVAAGTFAGGPIGDRIGRKRCDLGLDPLRSAPFTPGAAVRGPGSGPALLSVWLIGLVMSSAFSAIVVFAQELVPEQDRA